MLDYIWAGMILVGILSAAFTGHMADVTNGAISSARELYLQPNNAGSYFTLDRSYENRRKGRYSFIYVP